MQPKSDCLFHFTRSLDFLKSILSSGFLPRYSLEDVKPLETDFIGYPMVCFCDIPISRISEHTAFYGEYGIGLSKDWGLKNGLEPLMYVTPKSKLSSLANHLLSVVHSDTDTLKEGETDSLIDGLRDQFFKIIPMIKPISGHMLVSGKTVEKDFLQESEWRYVPTPYQALLENEFNAEKDKLNAEMENKKLEFTPSDIKYIFVKSDFEIPVVFDHIQNTLARFPLVDIKILISRITSLETLSKDV